MKPAGIIAVLLLALGLALWVGLRSSPSNEERSGAETGQPGARSTASSPSPHQDEVGIAVTYLCNEDKRIDAVFYTEQMDPDGASTDADRTAPNPDRAVSQPAEPFGDDSSPTDTAHPAESDSAAQNADSTAPPPVPDGRVHLVLSDGRQLTLKQTLSASGIRYSDGDPAVEGSESFVLWSKGNTALVLENNVQKSYIGCVAIAPDPGALPGTYANASEGYSIRYPSDWEVESDYTYSLAPDFEIHGVKFRVGESLTAGSNLSADSGISVETIYAPDLAKSGLSDSCSARAFLSAPRTVEEATEDGVEYSIATSMEAAAGNRYEEIVYLVKGSDPCLAVRYFIHYGSIENYDTGAVEEFDHASLLERLDSIRRTLTIAT